ncbi:MAG: hypothetical protein RL277_661 [Planctomycetota bacterium]
MLIPLLLFQSIAGQTLTPGGLPASIQTERVRIAVIGDFGNGSAESAQVAALVHGLDPQWVVTVGDNNYPLGEASTIDANIGALYSRYIGNYAGAFGAGAASNRFFPAMGNHDWYSSVPGQPYLDYFTLPGNERYYEQRLGPVHLFVLDSDSAEPDGNSSTSVQAQWLQSALAASDAPFCVVVLHHPPYSSGSHGSQAQLQWPFAAWGADLVLQGHDHVYERIQRGGFPYITTGHGGTPLYAAPNPIAGSESLYTARHGALWMEATQDALLLQALDTNSTVIDECVRFPNMPVPPSAAIVPLASTWRYLDTGVAPAADWMQPSFDDSSWPSGPGELGYGDGDEATVVQSGPAGNHHITTWFRKRFLVANPALYTDLEALLRIDDGMVLYLNGVEVARRNLPTGAVTDSTPALTAVNGAAESALTPFSVPLSLLQAGSNLLAVEVHQVNATSSDISFDLELRGSLYGTALIPRGSDWRYKDDGIAPPASWTQPGFADASWASGMAQLGYGDGDETTLVQSGPAGNHHITTWFRKSFSVVNPALVQGLYLRLLADDGVQVHLNGAPVFRRFLPRGRITSGTQAGYSVSGAEESRWTGATIDHRLLLPGANVISVEVHQVDPASSDLSFDLELFGL